IAGVVVTTMVDMQNIEQLGELLRRGINHRRLFISIKWLGNSLIAGNSRL
ncbi:MAG: hypothetical protein H7251_16305, partial [Acetobacteraceae bacterium]|nr:hypothetical protein [Acetobacteraceae bacterium]